MEDGEQGRLQLLGACLASLDRPYPAAAGVGPVHKEECCMCFGSPESPGGLLVDVRSLLPFCTECALWNQERTGNTIYLRIQAQEPPAPTPPCASASQPAQADAAADGERPLKKQTPSPQDPAQQAVRTVMTVLAEKHARDTQVELHYSLVAVPSFATSPFPQPDLPPPISSVASAIIAAEAMDQKQQLLQFEAGSEKKVSEAALTLQQQDNGVRIPPSPEQWKCAKCEYTQNLWLNLSDGAILCGRANWDGTGGNGHALAHYHDTKFPLAVKLGTITRDLSAADVFSYADDDAVIDPLLEDHLKHFGIDFAQMTKTEKTTAERELEQNLSFEWNRVEERGQQLQLVFGPGLTGLRNLGNSCYLASVMQVLFSTHPFISTYFSNIPLKAAFLAAPANPPGDFNTQLIKLAHGLLSGRYSKPDTRPREQGEQHREEALQEKQPPPAEQRGIPPRMFKAVIGRRHPEFSTARQQDAFEYLQYFFELLQEEPLPAYAAAAAAAGAEASPSGLGGRGAAARACRAFEFRVEEKIRCSASGRVLLKQREDNALSLPIPLEAAVPVPSASAATSGDSTAHTTASASAMETDQSQAQSGGRGGAGAAGPRLRVPLAACLAAFASADEISGFFSTAINGVTTAYRTVRFLTFPDYLVLHMRKYVVDSGSWIPKKLDVDLDVPHDIDLSFLRAPNGGGLLPGEEALPDSAAGGGGSPERGAAQAPAAAWADPGIVAALEGMGFPRERCERGAVATQNAGIEEAATWILTHDEDEAVPGLDAGLPQPGRGGAAPAPAQVNEEDLATLMSFGFSEVAARNALVMHGANMEQAADWILSNPEEAEREPQREPQPHAAANSGRGAGSAGAPSAGSGAGSEPLPDGPGRYSLFAFVSHMGANMQCGHYVCHIKKDGKWVLFNDAKVALSEDPPFEMGYLYFFQRTKQ